VKGADLNKSVWHLLEFISARGFSFVVQALPDSTRPAQEAADNIDCTVSQIGQPSHCLMMIPNYETKEYPGSKIIDIEKSSTSPASRRKSTGY